jgi:hypothetical protein
MSDRNADRFAVRPKFLAWLALAIALPVLAHAAWDYVEARRLRARVDAISAKGEPTLIAQIRPVRQLTDTGKEAARLYRAAAALASDWNRNSYVALAPPRNILNSAPQDWSPAEHEEANRLVSANSHVLDLVDRATAIEFSGFPPGTDYSYRFAEVWQLEQLASLRTRLYAVDRLDKALTSLHVQLLLLHAIDGEYPNMLSWFMDMISRDLALVVGRVRPTDASLAALETVLRALDRDDRVKRTLLAYRAESLNNGSPRLALSRPSRVMIPWEAVRRPFDLHRVNEVADMQAQYIEYADLPWPQRLEPFRDVDLGAFGELNDLHARQRYAAAMSVRQEARNAALVRSARIAIAIERARAANATPEIPTLIDPYSGKPMLVKRDDASYVVYSVGQNGRDDGGHATLDVTFRPVPATLSPPLSTLSPKP